MIIQEALGVFSRRVLMFLLSEAECPASLGWAPGLELNELCYLIGLDLNFV